MAGHRKRESIAALQDLDDALRSHRRDPVAPHDAYGDDGAGCNIRLRAHWLARTGDFFRGRIVRRCLYGTGAFAALVLLIVSGIWLRLLSGPIAFDIATPWLTAAIEENFGHQRKVEVGGTQLERDADGRTAIRIRDIVVRDADGAVVASAPKAEVSVSGSSLMSGRLRAERLNLVGAELAVRIEKNGRVTVFAGADKRPIATAPAVSSDPVAAARAKVDAAPGVPAVARTGFDELAALLAWIDGVSRTGLDGHELSQLGLKEGGLVVDDRRSGKRWKFEHINLGLTRSASGGVVFSVSSQDPQRPWVFSAAIASRPDGRRTANLEARKVLIKDLLLAMRFGDGNIKADVPLSASIRSEIGPDGLPSLLTGRIVVEPGTIGDPTNPALLFDVSRGEFNFEWDVARQILLMPFQVLVNGNRFTLLGRAEAPREPNGAWTLGLSGGTVVLAAANEKDVPVVLNRIGVRAKFDPINQFIELEQGNISNSELGVALSGSIRIENGDPHFAVGIAGTRMTVAAMTKIWPAFTTEHVHAWVTEHITNGTVERATVAINAPLSSLRGQGRPLTKDGLSVEIISSSTLLRPVESLPAIHDADLNVRVSGRKTTVRLSRGTVILDSGRKLGISNGVFEVADGYQSPPSSHTTFRLDGPVSAAAELLATERLRDFSGEPFDAATTRGTLSAQVDLSLPLKLDLPRGSSIYKISAEISNFVAEKMMLGQKIEAASLSVSATNDGYDIDGDVKISGTAAALKYRKAKGKDSPEIHIDTVLDDAARQRLGLKFDDNVTGAVPIKLVGRIGKDQSETQFDVDADLTLAEIDNLLPGWVKPAGRPARARFNLITRPQTARFDDLLIEGSGAHVKGIVEVDSVGEVITANFPIFALSDGDKTTLRAERAGDGTLKVAMRGDVYDGRNFVKSVIGGKASTQKNSREPTNLDLDIKIGAVAGFHGETLRRVELKMSRRAGQIRSLSLGAKLGVDTPLVGDLRGRADGKKVVYFETRDAGALFRFTDIYPRMIGGQIWVAMEPPGTDQAPRAGLLNVRNFSIRGEAALDRVVSGTEAGGPRDGVEFTRMRVEFTRSPGQFAIRDGVVRGPIVGATIEGHIDYAKNDVRMRGTFVPLYGLNNVFGQLPIVGLFLGGGSNEGLVGITYEVVGQPSAPILRVNPISAVAPGLLRKFFEFPGANSPAGAYVDPTR